MSEKSANAARQRRYRERTKAPNSGALVIPSIVLTDPIAIRVIIELRGERGSYRAAVEMALAAVASEIP